MAVNEQIVTGRKFRKLIDEANKLWQRISFWTKASDVEFNDGKNAETKFGAINGVTDSLTSTASNIAASAKAVKTLNDKVTQLSSNLEPHVKSYPVGVDSNSATIETNIQGLVIGKNTFPVITTIGGATANGVDLTLSISGTRVIIAATNRDGSRVHSIWGIIHVLA